VEEFRCQELKAEYRFLWIDAVYENVRSSGRVESVAVMIAYGVDREGHREVLAMEPVLFYQCAGEDQSGAKAEKPGGRGVSSVNFDLRFIVSYLMEYTEDWSNEYACIKPERFSQALESSLAQAAS